MARPAPAALAWALVACLGPAAAAGPPATDRLCLQTAPSPVPVATPVAGCSTAVCTPVGDEQACNCQKTDQRGERWFAQRRRNGQLLQQWATEVSPMMGPEALQVTQLDVDGDGRPEWVLAQFQAQSNGLGVSYHRLCVLWTGEPRRAPLCRDVAEWQQLTVLVKEEGRPGCSLVDSQWQSGRDARDKSRGAGTYAVGRVLRLQGPRWQPAADRAAVSRRLLDDFMNERESLPQSNAQRLWYQHPDARTGAPGTR
jgi:hypothetical protein